MIIAYSNKLKSVYKTDFEPPKVWCAKKSMELMASKLKEIGLDVDIYDLQVCYSLDELPLKHRKKPLYNI